MKTFVERLEEFENYDYQSVEAFNKFFPDAPLEWDDLSAPVEVISIAGPFNVRNLLVDSTPVKHWFNISSSSTQYTKSEYNGVVRWSGKSTSDYTTNKDVENEVMSVDEMNLSPTNYFLLQYLRGATSPYHTYREIGIKLGMSAKTISAHCKQLVKMEVIVITSEITDLRHRIEITEKWL